MKKLTIALLPLGFAFLVGFMAPQTNFYLHYFSAVLSLLFGILSWGLFHLIVPTRYLYHRKWVKLRIVCIPLVWITLVALLSVCLWRVPIPEDEILHNRLSSGHFSNAII